MSTKAKTAVKAPVKKAPAKPAAPAVAKKNAVTVNGPALKKAIADREQPKAEVKVTKKFHIWDVYGVKFLMDENNVPTRRTSMIEVNSDHDTANEPELRNKLIQDAENELIRDGYYMTDVDAMEAALFTAERVIDEIRHDLKYGERCSGCTANDLEDYTKWLEYLRHWRERRLCLAEQLGGCCNLPPVIPNDYQENWHIENDHLVPNVRKPKETTTTVIKANSISALPKEVAGLVGQLVGGIQKAALPPAKKDEPKKLPNKK